MHELSIAQSLVELATVEVTAAHRRSPTPVRVARLTVQVGALTCLHRSALEFSFELVAAGTPVEGAELQIEEVPAAIFCGRCQEVVELPGIQSFRCPRCQTPSAEIRRGRELDLVAIEIVETEQLLAGSQA